MRGFIVGGVLVALVATPASSASGGCRAERGAVHEAFATLQTDLQAQGNARRALATVERKLANNAVAILSWENQIGENEIRQSNAERWAHRHCRGRGPRLLCASKLAHVILNERHAMQEQHLADLETLEGVLSDREAALGQSLADATAQVDADRQALVDAKSALAACEAG